MKKGRYTNSGVRCPFYKAQNRSEIFCLGPERGSLLHIAFNSPAQRVNFQKIYCGLGNRRAPVEGDYTKCPYYQVHPEVEEDD